MQSVLTTTFLFQVFVKYVFALPYIRSQVTHFIVGAVTTFNSRTYITFQSCPDV